MLNISSLATHTAGFRCNFRWSEEKTNPVAENKLLHQQALASAQNNKVLSGRSRSSIRRSESSKGPVDLRSTSMICRNQSVVEDQQRRSFNDNPQENQDLLMQCVAQHLGFTRGRPVAACVMYRSLRHWGLFEVEKTSIFDQIIQTIAHTVETQDTSDMLAYWLSNSSSLLLLLQRTLKAAGVPGANLLHRRTSSATLFGRMTRSFRGTPRGANLSLDSGETSGGIDTLRQVEAKYPALLFKQQLAAFVEKIYGIVRDNLKREVAPQLGLCIQAPRIARSTLVKGTARTLANAAAQEILNAHWRGIVKTLSDFLSLMKENYVPPFLVRKVLGQIFSFINVQLFNSLLLRRECCSFSNGEYVRAGLDSLEDWYNKATEEYAGSAWDELRHIRQAIGFLVMPEKQTKTLDEIRRELCPALSVQQLYRIGTMYGDDKNGSQGLSPDVISSMRMLMTEDSSSAVSSSFLLDDDSSIPFSADELSKSADHFDISDIELPPFICDNAAFSFLLSAAD